MQITGFLVSAPDVAATRHAWERLGVTGVDIEVVAGDPGLTQVVLGVTDVEASERLLQRRGLTGGAEGFDLGGTSWRLAPITATSGDEGGDARVDHVVVVTADADRAAANFGARLGLDLRLDRASDLGFRGMFFRLGDAVVEVIVPTEPPQDSDSFGGVAWWVPDLDAARARLGSGGVEVSEAREGRKPGTRVATVRDPELAVPTLLISAEGPQGPAGGFSTRDDGA